MEKRWALLEQGAKETSENLANELNIDACLAQVLVQRGITNFEDANQFVKREYRAGWKLDEKK